MVDMTPPLTQTIRERQEAVKAVASLGHGGAPPRTGLNHCWNRTRYLIKSPAHRRTQPRASRESPPGPQTRSSDTPKRTYACPCESRRKMDGRHISKTEQ
ncbi:hypothetical protein NDU88_006998 [Pleurodeles waltl]|uniref:Uncharacterized protein n=1 Tax=Pleurodeles waltl TaxID=8319 RepID=A0AAV7U073_PLEWA|nr:hypothetical protein NDU88_006998 [Pleurodeles waltl]